MVQSKAQFVLSSLATPEPPALVLLPLPARVTIQVPPNTDGLCFFGTKGRIMWFWDLLTLLHCRTTPTQAVRTSLWTVKLRPAKEPRGNFHLLPEETPCRSRRYCAAGRTSQLPHTATAGPGDSSFPWLPSALSLPSLCSTSSYVHPPEPNFIEWHCLWPSPANWLIIASTQVGQLPNTKNQSRVIQPSLPSLMNLLNFARQNSD